MIKSVKKTHSITKRGKNKPQLTEVLVWPRSKLVHTYKFGKIVWVNGKPII